jgi:hypothetical protein
VPALNSVGELGRYSSRDINRYSSSAAGTLSARAQATRRKNCCGVSITSRVAGFFSR